MVEHFEHHGSERIRFSSREELAGFYRKSIDEHLKDAPHLSKLDMISKYTESDIAHLQELAFGREPTGPITKAVFGSIDKSDLDHLLRQTRRHAEKKLDDLADVERMKQNFTPKPMVANTPSKPNRVLAVAGIAGGGALAIHGAWAAATAVKRDDREKRDWGKTALHTAEAIVGAGVTWASAVALRGKAIVHR